MKAAARPVRLSDTQIRLLRMRAQQLVSRRPRSAGTVARIVAELCGVQAQDSASAALAVRARASGLRRGDVERALVRERTVVRTWCMRGTLHLVASSDLAWLLRLFGPVFLRSSRGRRERLGLDEVKAARGAAALLDLLREEGPLTRRQIVEGLAREGLRLEGQARPHLIAFAALQGLVCHGPERDGEPTYVPLNGWIEAGPALEPGEARVELARRYLSAYAPAAAEDLAAWSGLSLSQAREGWDGIAGELVEVATEHGAAWVLGSQAAWLDAAAAGAPLVRLAPAFDPYLLGTRHRDAVADASHMRRIYPGGGLLRPALLIDGVARGTWRLGRRGTELTVEPFGGLSGRERSGLEAEAADLGRFLGTEPRLRLAEGA